MLAQIHALNALVSSLDTTRRWQRPELPVFTRLYGRWTVHKIILSLGNIELIRLCHFAAHSAQPSIALQRGLACSQKTILGLWCTIYPTIHLIHRIHTIRSHKNGPRARGRPVLLCECRLTISQ